MNLIELVNGAVAGVARVFEAAYGLGWWGILLIGIIFSVGWSLTFNYDSHQGDHRRGGRR